MGMIAIEMKGSFPDEHFETSAMEGGHVMALTRSINYLTKQLPWAVQEDVKLTTAGEVPSLSDLGTPPII